MKINETIDESKNSAIKPKALGGGVYYKAEIAIIPLEKADVITASNLNDDGENDPFAVKNLGE